MISISILQIGINSTSNSDLNGANDHKTHADSNFLFAEISVDQVNEELKAIPANKASGLDSVCTKLIKYGSNAIAGIFM